jgi:hypothetical protein
MHGYRAASQFEYVICQGIRERASITDGSSCAREKQGMDMIEITANKLVECELNRMVIGLEATRNGGKEEFFRRRGSHR